MTRTGTGRAPRRDGAGDTPGGLASRTLTGLKWAFLTSVAQAILSLGIVMVLSRLLTPEAFGQLAIALIFLTLADTVGRRGLGPALVQRLHLTERHIATAFTLSVLIGVALAAALWWLAPWLARLLEAPRTAPILRALTLVTVFAGLGAVSEHRLRRALRFRALMRAAVVSQVIGNGLVPIALALMGHGVWALVWGTVARQAVFTLAVIASVPTPRALFAGPREAADLVHTGAGFSAIALLNQLTAQATHLVIARTLGAAPLGLYTRARALAVVPARLSPVLIDVLMPAMARRQRRTDRLRTVYLNGAEMMSLLALPASLTIAVSAPEVVAVVLGAQWGGAVPALVILAVAGVLQPFNALNVPLIRALGAVYRESWRRAAYLVLIVLSAWFGSRWGLAGVVAGVSAASVVLHGLLIHLALHLLGLRWRPLLARQVPALWAGAWAAAAVTVAAAAARGAAWPSIVGLALELAAGGSAAAAAVYYAPPPVRPTFPHWVLARLPLETMGPAARPVRRTLEHLARRWPAPGQSATA